jgi:hypothetical protein
VVSVETAVVLRREVDERSLVVEVGLLQLVVGVSAPVHSVLVNGNIYQVLVELHHHHLVVLRTVVEEHAHLARTVPKYLEAKLVLEFVLLDCRQQLSTILN